MSRDDEGDDGARIPIRLGSRPKKGDLDRDDVADELRTQGMRVVHVQDDHPRDEDADLDDAARLFNAPKRRKQDDEPADTNNA